MIKRIPFLFLVFTLFTFQLAAQTHQRGHGAASVQELGQTVVNALKDNQFTTLNSYLPDDVELRILRRRSSPDMRALLEKTSPDSIKQSLQANFNNIVTQTTANTFNWNNYQLSDTKATQADKKNRALFRVQVSITNLAGQEQQLYFEAIRIRNRYFLFKQMIFHAGAQPN